MPERNPYDEISLTGYPPYPWIKDVSEEPWRLTVDYGGPLSSGDKYWEIDGLTVADDYQDDYIDESVDIDDYIVENNLQGKTKKEVVDAYFAEFGSLKTYDV